MAIDDEQKQKDFTAGIEKVNKGLASTVKSLLKNAKSEEDKAKVLRLSTQALKEQLAGIKGNSAATKLQRLELANSIKSMKGFGGGVSSARLGVAFLAEKALEAGAALKDYIADTAKSTFKTGVNFADAGEKIKQYSDISKEYTGTLGKGFTGLLKIVDFNTDIFKQLSQTGAGFNGNMMNFRDAAKEARMPLLDFVDMVQKNSSVMARLFGSVQSGVPQLTSFNRSLRDVTKNELAQYGLNLEETTEFLTTYLELERSRGATQQRTTAEVVAGTRDYAKNLVLLSKLTGKSVKELDEQTKAVAADGSFRALLSDMTPDAAKGFTLMLGELDKVNPLFGQLFKEVTAFGGAANTQTAQLDMMTKGALTRAMKAFDGSPDSIINLTNVLKEAGSQGIRTGKSFALASIAGGDFSDQLIALARAAGIAVDPERIKAQMAAQDEFTKSAVAGRDVIDAVKASVEGQATEAQKILIQEFGDKFPDLLKIMEESAEKLNVENPVAKAYDSTKKAIRVTSSFFSNLGTEEGTGRGTLLSTADDSVAGMVRRAMQRFSEGGEANSFLDILTPFDTLSEKIANFNKGDGFASGTLGATGNLFNDFGSGTLATLHGEEAVVPRNSAMGAVLSMLDQLTARPATTAATAPTVKETQNNSEFMRMNAILSENLKGLSEVMVKSEKHLNTLVAIGAKTERNTGETKRGLANMSPSLV